MKKLFFTLLCATSLLSANMDAASHKLRQNEELRELYIDLVKKTVANTLYGDASFYGDYDPALREAGLDFPKVGHTMIGKKRLDNIHNLMKNILKNGIPGDFVETGVWRGGAKWA